MIAKQVLLLLVFLALSSLNVQAQTDSQAAPLAGDVDGMRAEIRVLAGVLADGLELNAASGFPGITSGRVEGVYLLGQGVMLEIQSPLANQRNRLSLSALASSLRNFTATTNLTATTNPFAEIASRADGAASAAERALSRATELAAGAYQQSLDELRSVDYAALTENAIRRADRAARLLRDLGAMEAGDLVAAQQGIDALRRRLQDNLAQVRQLQNQADESPVPAAADSSADQSPAQLPEALRSGMAELVTSATSMADSLDRQYQQAREDYRQNWQQEVENFEASLFQLLCEFGVTVRSLPQDQYLTVVLPGLGAENERARPGDRIHVIGVAQLRACEAGAIDARALQQQATSYSY